MYIVFVAKKNTTTKQAQDMSASARTLCVPYIGFGVCRLDFILGIEQLESTDVMHFVMRNFIFNRFHSMPFSAFFNNNKNLR